MLDSGGGGGCGLTAHLPVSILPTLIVARERCQFEIAARRYICIVADLTYVLSIVGCFSIAT